LSDGSFRALFTCCSPVAGWLGADIDAVMAELHRAVAPSFAVWYNSRERSIEDVLARKGTDEAEQLRRRLELLAVGRLAYRPALMPDGQLPQAIQMLSVPDRDISSFQQEAGLEVTSTGDYDHIFLLRLALGIPASALVAWDEFAQAAKEMAQRYPIYNLPGLSTDLDTRSGAHLDEQGSEQEPPGLDGTARARRPGKPDRVA
jgi:hypothetical protein